MGERTLKVFLMGNTRFGASGGRGGEPLSVHIVDQRKKIVPSNSVNDSGTSKVGGMGSPGKNHFQM